MNIQLHDPRPDDMAELARLTAIELRKRGIWAHPRWEDGCISVIGYHGHRQYDKAQLPAYHPYLLTYSDFDNFGPIGCADAIQDEEAKRAQEWAGDA